MTVVLLVIGIALLFVRPAWLPLWASPIVAAVVGVSTGVIRWHLSYEALRVLRNPLLFLLFAVPLAVLLDRIGVERSLATKVSGGHHLLLWLWVLAVTSTTARCGTGCRSSASSCSGSRPAMRSAFPVDGHCARRLGDGVDADGRMEGGPLLCDVGRRRSQRVGRRRCPAPRDRPSVGRRRHPRKSAGPRVRGGRFERLQQPAGRARRIVVPAQFFSGVVIADRGQRRPSARDQRSTLRLAAARHRRPPRRAHLRPSLQPRSAYASVCRHC